MVATIISTNAIMRNIIRIRRCFENRLAMQAEATLKRAIIESIVTFSKKTDAILHSAIMVNIALADKQRILSSGILNTFLVLIYRTLCFNSFHSCLSLNQPKDRAKIKENFLTESILSWNIVKRLNF